jgi:predicted transcriptional regulator
MTRGVKTVKRQMSVRELNQMFESDDFNTYPVEEETQVVGLVTKFDPAQVLCLHAQPNGSPL